MYFYLLFNLLNFHLYKYNIYKYNIYYNNMDCDIRNTLVVGTITSVVGTTKMVISIMKKIDILKHLIIFF